MGIVKRCAGAISGRTLAGGVVVAIALPAMANAAMAAMPASLRLPAAFPTAQQAQFVCDATGCGAGAGRAAPSGNHMGRPYFSSNAAERRALEERDRLRRERGYKGGRGGAASGR